MLQSIKNLLVRLKIPHWLYILAVLIVFLFVLNSCQGLFNVNTKDSNVDVVLNDSLNIGGTK